MINFSQEGQEKEWVDSVTPSLKVGLTTLLSKCHRLTQPGSPGIFQNYNGWEYMLYVCPHKQHFKAAVPPSIYSFYKRRLENSCPGACTHGCLSISKTYDLCGDTCCLWGGACSNADFPVFLTSYLTSRSLGSQLSNRPQWKLIELTCARCLAKSLEYSKVFSTYF